jgi:hypothetical protein
MRKIVILITLAHAFHGFMGLTLEAVGKSKSDFYGISVWVMIGLTVFAGLHFNIGGQSDDDEVDHSKVAAMLMASLYSAAAIFFFNSVSFDELFAVLQRFQWMMSLGWSIELMALNIALSMVVLWCILASLELLMEHKGESLSTWAENHGEALMFCVFSIIMYYMVRAVAQNGLGYQPIQDPITGISPELLAAGFALNAGLNQLLKFEPAKVVLQRVFCVDGWFTGLLAKLFTPMTKFLAK